MKKREFIYTKQAHQTLQYAQMVSQCTDKKHISSLTLFWGVFAMVSGTDQAGLFWTLLGVTNYESLETYFDAHYGSVLSDQKPERYQMVGSLFTLIDAQSADVAGKKSKVDFVGLLYASLNGMSQSGQKTLLGLNLDLDVIKKNCHYIIHNIVLEKVGLFVFLEILSKLMESLPLDTSDMQIMTMDIEAIQNAMDHDVMDRNSDGGDKNSSVSVEKKDAEDKQLTVEYFGTDLVQEYADGFIDPIIGRDKEIQQMIYTLLRKSKNNPLLVGEAGVGKTAVVEGLAQKIAAGDVPQKLQGKRLFMLDMGTLVAGTKYRGEFEGRMKSILEEASDPTNNIILFIDEIHTIIGAGGQDSNDAAQLIKPLLARGKIKLVGATTFDEYQKYIEKDAALKRRFQEVTVDEPDAATTKDILMGLKDTYERYHGVFIEETAIESAIALSQRYVLNRHLPDKAIDIIDEACAKQSTMGHKLEQDDSYKKLEKKIKNIDARIEEAIAKQDYFAAADLKKKQEGWKQEISQVRETKLLPEHLRQKVTVTEIGVVLADKTGIPASFVSESEIEKLKRLKSDLETEVLGQEEAVQSVVKAITRNRLSVIDRQNPIASFLFLGPSGTGKTHLAKTIARDYFNDEKAMIRVDMSEFMETSSVSKLIGSAPGYVGHEQGGLLTEQVRRNPYSVILFDEIEKASKDVLNILLQILDEGHLKDNKGRWIDFKSTVVVMTSNLGSEEFAKKKSQIGFSSSSSDEKSTQDLDTKKSRVMDHVKKFLSPELLNRLDYTIVFEPLTKEHLAAIFKKEYASFAASWDAHEGVTLPKMTKAKITKIIDKIYDPTLGARPIARYIQQEVENEIIEDLLK